MNRKFETMQKETVHVSTLIEPTIKVGGKPTEQDSKAVQRKKKKEQRRDRAQDFEGGHSDDSGDNVLDSGAVSEAEVDSNEENKLQEKLKQAENSKKEEEEVDDEDSIDPIFEADDDEEDFQEPPKIGQKREGEQLLEKKNKKQKTS